MKTNKLLILICVLAALLGLAPRSSKAQSLTFDSANSNIGAGLYDFDFVFNGLYNFPSPGARNGSTDLYLSGFSAIGNTQNPLTYISAPSAWIFISDNGDHMYWDYYSAGTRNGDFVVEGTPNLSGNIAWTLTTKTIPIGSDPLGTIPKIVNLNGNTSIEPAPEPSTLGFIGICALVYLPLVARHLKKRSRSSFRDCTSPKSVKLDFYCACVLFRS